MARPVIRFGGVVALTVLVVAARIALNPWLGLHQNRHLVFLPTIILAAWFGGLGPGLLSAAISAVAIVYFWTNPASGFVRIGFEVVLYLLISGAICVLFESLRIARARADAARKSREQVLAIVAHDLRNPLSTVKATASIMQQLPVDRESLRHRLGAIDRAVARMELLIRDLVDATRIEYGELAISVRPESIESSIAQEAVDLQVRLTREKNVSVELEIARGDDTLTCDRDRLLQVLDNLLGNAMKFAREGDHITLRIQDDGGAVRFEVEDTGPGIEPEHLPHIFERYWKGTAGGTGLGLFIAQSIVRAHGGLLEVRSQPGQGATFLFSVPRLIPTLAASVRPKHGTRHLRSWLDAARGRSE